MLSLPDKFVAFTLQTADQTRGILLECVRVQYNYQDIYRLLPITHDEYRHEYPPQLSGFVRTNVPEDARYYREQESSILVQTLGSGNSRLQQSGTSEVFFYRTAFEVCLEDSDIPYDDYDRHLWRQHRNRHDRYFPLVVLFSNSGNFLYSRSSNQTTVNLDMNESIFRDCENILQEMSRIRRNRHWDTSSATDGYYNPTILRHPPHPFLHNMTRRRAGVIEPPQTPPRLERRIHRGAGASDEEVARGSPSGGEHTPQRNREVRVVLQRPPLPSERVCIALARDYIAQGETCPILQEPLAWGSIAVTACHCVFTGDSLAVWAANHTTCPSCRQHLQYRVVSVEKPLVNDGQPVQTQTQTQTQIEA